MTPKVTQHAVEFICGMASRIAAGIEADGPKFSEEVVAKRSVDIAVSILDAVMRLVSKDPAP